MAVNSLLTMHLYCVPAMHRHATAPFQGMSQMHREHELPVMPYWLAMCCRTVHQDSLAMRPCS